MKKSLFLAMITFTVVVALAAPGPAAADTFVFPHPPDVNALGNISGAYRDFSIFSQNTLDCINWAAVIGLPQAMQAGAQVAYTPTDPTQPGWVNPGYDWPGGQHTYVINLPSPTGGQLPAVPGLHPINGLSGTDSTFGGVSGLLVLYNEPVSLPNLTNGRYGSDFLDPDFLNKVSAIVAFVPGVSTAVVYEKDPVPEPATLLLLGCGLVGLIGIRKVSKKQ